jgi:hypothetical protein
MTDKFNKFWCKRCGLIDETIVVDKYFGSLCEDNFWGDYKLTIACANCSAEETIWGTHDGVQAELVHDDPEILFPSDSNEAQEFVEKVAEFELKVSNNALELAVVNNIIRELCSNEDILLQSISEVSLKPMQTGFEVPYLVFKTYENSNVNDFLQDILDEQKYSSFQFDCQPIITVEYGREGTEDAISHCYNLKVHWP